MMEISKVKKGDWVNNILKWIYKEWKMKKWWLKYVSVEECVEWKWIIRMLMKERVWLKWIMKEVMGWV